MHPFRIKQDNKFLDGVNYQLHYGFDFGENKALPGLGLHDERRLELFRNDLGRLTECGIHSIRMNIFSDGRSGIVYDGTGGAVGVQACVVEALLGVLCAAEENDVVVSFVMLDHKIAERAEWIDAAQPESGTKQGHSRLLLTAAGREEMIRNVCQPVLQQLGRSKPASLLSFELVNEPESLIQGLSPNPFMQRHLPRGEFEEFKTFMRSFRDLVHQETGAQFTVGSLALKHAAVWLDVLDPGLDYLSVHYYGANGDPHYKALYTENTGINPLKTAKGLQSRIPLVWGEYAANGSSEFLNREYPQSFPRAIDFLEEALNNGAKGAYAWALRSGIGGWGDLFGPVPLETHKLFTARHASQIEFLGSRPPLLSDAAANHGERAG
jgi:hypothetical protein